MIRGIVVDYMRIFRDLEERRELIVIVI